MFGVPQYSFYVMVLVLALLCLGSAVCWFKKLKHPEKDYTELSQRITSWWWIIGLVFFVLILSKNAAIAFFWVCELSRLERVPFHHPYPPNRQTRHFVGVHCDSTAILMGRVRMVWDVPHLYSRLRLFVLTDAHGVTGRNQRVYPFCWRYSLGHDVNGAVYQPYRIFVGTAG